MTIQRIKQLREERARVWEEYQGELDRIASDESLGIDAETKAKFDEMDSRLDGLGSEIEVLERGRKLDDLDVKHFEEKGEPGSPEKRSYDAVFDTWVRGGAGSLELEDRQLLAEHRAQSVGTDSAGGYTVPEGFWNRVQETMLAFGGVLEVANVISTATGNTLPWPTNDDTANEGAILGENTQITEQDLTFGSKNLDAYKYTSKLVRVSYELLQDSAIDIEGFLARKLAMRLARIHNRHFTVGTGTGQPDGIAVSPVTGKTAASATAVTHDELIDLIHSVDPAYRIPSSRFMFADGTAAAIRKVTDGDGNKAWQPGLKEGQPDTLLGYGITVNQNMPAMTTGNVAALFGDFNSGYVVRNVKDAQLVRLDERYADYLQVGFFMFDRADGTKDDTAAYKALVMA